MIYAFIRSLIGEVGRAILGFYVENSLGINTLVLCYGLLEFIAHRNYYMVLEKIILDLRENNQKFANSQIKKVSTKEYERLRWEMIRHKIWFPLLSEPQKATIQACTIKNLNKIFSLNKLNQLLQEANRKKIENGEDHVDDS